MASDINDFRIKTELPEETEIKIEYTETLDEDPLCESRSKTIATQTCLEDLQEPEAFKYELEVEKSEPLSDQDNDVIEVDNNSNKIIEVTSDDQFSDDGVAVNDSDEDFVIENGSDRKSDTKLAPVTKKSNRNNKRKCHICNNSFKSVGALRKHVVVNHRVKNLEISCRECKTVFQNVKEKIIHLMNEHYKKPDYSCVICGYKTPKRYQFDLHMHTHRHDKNKESNDCDNTNGWSLRIYQLLHSRQKTYKCDEEGCNKVFGTPTTLQCHKRKHKPEAYLKYCDQCTYKTVVTTHLQRHMECHKRNTTRNHK